MNGGCPRRGAFHCRRFIFERSVGRIGVVISVVEMFFIVEMFCAVSVPVCVYKN